MEKNNLKKKQKKKRTDERNKKQIVKWQFYTPLYQQSIKYYINTSIKR